MTYGTRAAVKRLLHLEDDDTWDDEIDDCLDWADEIINNELSQYVDTPLSSTPSMIQLIANDLAAGLFCENHVMERREEMAIFSERAQKNLERYIFKNYGLYP